MLNRYHIKSWVGQSPYLESCWSALDTLRARWLLRQHRWFDGARLLLRLEKHLDRRALAGVRARLLQRIINDCCRPSGPLGALAENSLLRSFVESAEAAALRRQFSSYGREHQVRLRLPRKKDDPERQGDLIILKRHAPKTGERGVVLVKYHQAILSFAAIFDLPALVSNYVVVLEPSNWGYQDARFLIYVGRDAPVVVECARGPDFDYIRQLNTNVTPVRIGDGEWTDPAVFLPRRKAEGRFDVVMVAAWDPLKRHEILFRAIARLKEEGRCLRVALIGYPLTWSRKQIESLMRRRGVSNECTIYEGIPHHEVARIVADAGVAVLLSRQEGSNRSVYECLFANTPVIVLRDHRGINLDDIGPETGMLATDDDLSQAIQYVLDHRDLFHPRAWAAQHSGYLNATHRLNNAVRDVELRNARPWTCDIVAKINAPNLRYAKQAEYREFEGAYRHLSQFLLPLSS